MANAVLTYSLAFSYIIPPKLLCFSSYLGTSSTVMLPVPLNRSLCMPVGGERARPGIAALAGRPLGSEVGTQLRLDNCYLLLL